MIFLLYGRHVGLDRHRAGFLNFSFAEIQTVDLSFWSVIFLAMNSRIFVKRSFKKQREENSKRALSRPSPKTTLQPKTTPAC